MSKNTVSTSICVANLIIWLMVALVSSHWLIQVSYALIDQPEAAIFMVSMMRVFISVSIMFILLGSKPALRKDNFLDRKIYILLIGLAMLALLYIS